MSLERISKGGIDQLTQDVYDMNLNTGKYGDWDDVAKNIVDTDGWRSWGEGPQNVGVQAIAHSVTTHLQDGLSGADRVGFFDVNVANDVGKESGDILDTTTDAEDGEDTYSSSDDEYIGYVSDGFDSDECTHESQKNHRMLKVFFESLDKLTLDEINSPIRRWHCPVCQGTQNGPCAIFWYRGLSALTVHARTKYSIRPRLHRGFLKLLEEELRRRFGSAAPTGESYNHWEGSTKEGQDHAIIWPALVVVMNATPDKCNDKGTGIQELLDNFSSNAAVKARHLYGPQGHRGISLLIFESSAAGYLEAERLHKHFLEQGTGREAWEQRCKLFNDEGRHQLYGYLATKDDVELFNQGKLKVKYELRPYSKLVSQLKQMSEDNQQLTWSKQKAAQEKKYLEKLEESLNSMSEILKRGVDKTHILTQMSKLHYPQGQGQDQDQDQQMEKKKVQELSLCVSSEEDHESRMREVECMTKSEDLEKSQFAVERNELMRDREGRKYECLKRCLDELLEIEKGFDVSFELLKEKHASGFTGADASSASFL